MTRILLSLLGFSVAVNALAIRYYPDGVTIESAHVPCNQTMSGASACCDTLDSCSVSGYCLGRSGWDYRGSCTDQSWTSPNCANAQSSYLTDASTTKKYSGFTALWSCANTPRTSENTWCCAQGNSSSSCRTSSFTSPLTGVAFMPGHDQFVINITNAAIAAYKSNSSSTSGGDTLNASYTNPSGNGDLGMKVGLGVGIPLGVLVLGVLGWLSYREWMKKHHAGMAPGAGAGGRGEAYESVGTSSSMEQPGGVAGGFAPAYQQHGDQMGQQSYSPPTQKPSAYVPPPSGVYEAPTGGAIHEMRA